MPLTARCHTLRPFRNSGWWSYFELAATGPRVAHFLVVGPASGSGDRDAALRAGQAAVRYLKGIPANAPTSTLLEGAVRIANHESKERETPIALGVAVLENETVRFMTSGEVCLVPLAPQAGDPIQAHEPREAPASTELRFFLGRIPGAGSEGPQLAEFINRLERGGVADGGLIISFVAKQGLAAVAAGRGATLRQASSTPPSLTTFDRDMASGAVGTPEAPRKRGAQGRVPERARQTDFADLFDTPVEEPGRAPEPSVETTPERPEPPDDPAPAETPSVAAPEEAITQPAPAEPPADSDPGAPLSELEALAALDEARQREDLDELERLEALDEATETADAPLEEEEPEESAPALDVEAPALVPRDLDHAPSVDEILAEDDSEPAIFRTRSEPDTVRGEGLLDEPSRGLGFWLGLIAALGAIAMLVTYVTQLRPGSSEPGPAAVEETDAATAPLIPDLASVPAAILWETTFPQPVTSTPLVDGERVVFGCRDGSVYALSAVDGSRVWAYAAGSGFGSSPALAGEAVVLGAYDGTIYGLARTTGEELWTVPTGGKIVASPVVGDDTVFLGSYDHHLYAVNPVDGTVRWKKDVGAVLWSSPALGEGVVVVGDLNGRVTAYDPATGSRVWRAEGLGAIYSSPVVAEGKVILGAGTGAVLALDAATGETVWSVDAASDVGGSPAYHEGRVVIGADSGRILGIDVAMGQVVWQGTVGGAVKSRPAFLGEAVWITAYDGVLHGFDWMTGKELAGIRTDAASFSSPRIGDGTAYFGAMDGRVFAVRLGLAGS